MQQKQSKDKPAKQTKEKKEEKKKEPKQKEVKKEKEESEEPDETELALAQEPKSKDPFEAFPKGLVFSFMCLKLLPNLSIDLKAFGHAI